MKRHRRAFRLGLALVGGAVLGGAAPASAQIGALAAAAAAAGSGDDYALAGAPIFAESGLVLTEGWTAGAFGVLTAQTVEGFDGFSTFDVDYSTTYLSVGAFASVGERAMIGAVVNPYISAEASAGGESQSVDGLGNLTAIGKLALTTSGATRLAATASVELPIGDEDVASRTPTISAGLGASHALDDATSLHGGISVGVTSDDGDTVVDEAGTSVGFDAAVVRQLNDGTWLSGEVLGSTFEGEWQVLLAPGARFRAGDQLFIDIGLALGALSSDGIEPIDYGVAVGATFIPGR